MVNCNGVDSICMMVGKSRDAGASGSGFQPTALEDLIKLQREVLVLPCDNERLVST